jgi:hypothetical protein
MTDDEVLDVLRSLPGTTLLTSSEGSGAPAIRDRRDTVTRGSSAGSEK